MEKPRPAPLRERDITRQIAREYYKEFDQLIESDVIIVGAGPIGCELAQCFARFGSEVTLIQRSAGILGREDRDAARLVQESLERDGVRVLFETSVTEVGKRGNSKVLSLEQAGRRRELEVEDDRLLLGVQEMEEAAALGIGPIAFDDKGDLKDGPITIYVVKGGKWEPLETVKPQAASTCRPWGSSAFGTHR